MKSVLPLLLYLLAVTFAITQSRLRWLTFLWVLVGLGATIALFFVLSLIWTDLAGVLGHVVLIPALLVSVLVGLNHMRTHRRTSTSKSMSNRTEDEIKRS